MQIGGKYRDVAQRCQLSGVAAVDSVLAALFPWVCALCGRAGAGFDLCASCLDELPWLDDARGSLSLQGVTGLTALAYKPPVDRMVTELKYHRGRVWGRLLGEMLAIRAQELLRERALALPEYLVPVPLHHRRLRSRGYNQAALIARSVGQVLGIPVMPRFLQRDRYSLSQTRLGRGRRLRNPAGMFTAGSGVSGRRVAVIDDVITTGATLGDCTRALQDAGARSVHCWAAARTLANGRGQALSGSKV